MDNKLDNNDLDKMTNDVLIGGKKKSKCPVCQKKLTLLDIVCKCGIKHCRAHCLPEYHNCKMDIAGEKNKKLMNEMLVIDNDKIDCRI